MLCSSCQKLLNNKMDYCPFCGQVISSFETKESKPTAHEKQHLTPDCYQRKIENDKEVKKELDNQNQKRFSQGFKPSIILKKEIRATNEVFPEIKETENTYKESDRLKNFKKRHNVNEVFKPYKNIKEEELKDTFSTLRFSNKSLSPFVTRITGIGNLFYNEYRIKPFQKMTIKLQNGTYSIKTFIEGSEIVWNSKITEDEEQYYSRSPQDSRLNSDNRTVSFNGGSYDLSCGGFIGSIVNSLKSLF